MSRTKWILSADDERLLVGLWLVLLSGVDVGLYRAAVFLEIIIREQLAE